MRDERRPVDDDDELRRDDDKLAMRPNARMAVPVFYVRKRAIVSFNIPTCNSNDQFYSEEIAHSLLKTKLNFKKFHFNQI